MSLLSKDHFFNQDQVLSELSDLSQDSFKIRHYSASDSSVFADAEAAESVNLRLMGQPKKRPAFIVMNG